MMSGNNKILLFSGNILICLLICNVILSINLIKTDIRCFVLGICIVYWVSCFWIEKKVCRKLVLWGLRPSYICFLGLCVVNLQFFIDDIFNIGVIPDLGVPNYTRYNDVCFYCGLLFNTVFVMSNTIHNKSYQPIILFKRFTSSWKAVTPWLYIYVISFILFLLTIDIVKFMTGAIYKESNASEALMSNSFEHIFNVVTLIIISIYTNKLIHLESTFSIKEYIKSISYIFWIPFILYTSLRLFSGDRGPVLYNILIVFYSYTIVTHKLLSFKKTLPLIIIGAFSITLLGFVRSRSTELSYIDKIQEAVTVYGDVSEKKSTISPLTEELAKSVRCNYIALRDIEEERIGYQYGKYTILSTLTAFPSAKRTYFEKLGLKDIDFSSADYMTFSYSGPSHTWGTGSTVLGEAYLDFGIIGIILIAFIVGKVFKYVDNIFLIDSRKLNAATIMFVLQFASHAIYISRSSFSFSFSDMVYSYVIYIGIGFIINFKSTFTLQNGKNIMSN